MAVWKGGSGTDIVWRKDDPWSWIISALRAKAESLELFEMKWEPRRSFRQDRDIDTHV